MTVNLSLENVTKSYGKKNALSGFTYQFEPGIYGLLGANGAGKSTLFYLLTDTLGRDSGSICWNGKEIQKMGRDYRKILGYMPQGQSFYREMTVREFLIYMGCLKGISKKSLCLQIDNLLKVVGLEEAVNFKMKSLSGGMRQRVLLVQALLGDPKIVLLDEPTAGVDPEERIKIRSYISSIAKERIVLLATHIVSDIECIANRVLLMKKGVLVKEGMPAELIFSIREKVAEKICGEKEAEQYQKKYGPGMLLQRQEGQVLRLIGDQLPDDFVRVKNGISMEDVYLYYCVSDMN